MAKLDQWMQFCRAGAETFSTCSRRQYFAVVLDVQGHVAATGYNGGPKGTVHCVDGGCPRAQQNSTPGLGYDNCIAIHAEQNALLHSDYTTIQGGTLIVNGPPCYTCAKLIVNSGIATVVFHRDDAYPDFGKVRDLFAQAGISLVEA